MIYPSNFESKVGFDRIRFQLEALCLSDMGRAKVREISFTDDFGLIIEKLESTEEFREILLSTKAFPSQDYFDLRVELRRLAVEGTYIDPEKLAELRCSLKTIADILLYFKKSAPAKYPRLKRIIEPAGFDEGLIKSIDKILDDKARIRDIASPELKKIREEQGHKKIQVEKRIRQIYLALRKEGVTADDAEITIRGGRSVIPLPAANKRRIKGFIHDESATGQTIYIEPEEVFELNNELRELESAEKREIIRILIRFTDELRPHIEPLFISYNILAELDLIRAKSSFALQINALLPKTNRIPAIDFRKAINPILFLTNRGSGKDVVPLDIKLDKVNRILVISGPNAGGKSVCLKTTGLLQYMLQCGLLIPAKDDSETGIFKRIFIEIGDEQSIENDLSTYSSHLKNIRHLAETAEEGTLFLIDEFGSGTEPQSGGAIAEATLEKLSDTGALGVVTTHYLNLKLMAGNVPGIVNGAMMFDTKKMHPLYKLVLGKPGSSFAFEIAGKIGFPKEILESAGQKTGSAILNFENQLQELENDRKEIEKQKAEFILGDELLSKLIDRYKQQSEKLESSRKQIIEQAHSEASALLEKANQMIENTIRTIKESQAEKEKTREARNKLQTQIEELKKTETEPEEEEESKPARKITKKYISKEPTKTKKTTYALIQGGYAKIKGQNTVCEIEEIKGEFALVVKDNLRLKIPLDQLEGIDSETEKNDKKNSRQNYSNISESLNKRLSEFKPSIDIRGTRADEVHPIIQKFVDDAILLDVPEIRILHGKGYGVLRQIIHEYLRSVKEIKSFGDEVLERGGAGITVIRFRRDDKDPVA
jgi:DNA mismatch repair protein MutS2